MPVYKRKDRADRWMVRIYASGQPLTWMIEGTKKDAEAFEARKRVELETQGTEIRTVPTFTNFCVSHYRRHAERHLKKRTWSNRRYTLRTLCNELGDLKLTAITRPVVEEYQDTRTRLGIRPNTVNDEVKVLRAVLAYAKAISVPVCEFSAPDLPVVETKVTFWTAAEVQRLLKAIADEAPQIYWMVMLLLNTGCRRGEAVAFEWDWVDLDAGLFRIQPNADWQPKNGKPREIPIEAVLLPYLKAPRASKRYVFPSRKGERFAYWPQRKFDRARKAAGLQGGPHTTRHTYATHFLAERSDLHLLSRILGHSHGYVTELYSHLLPDHLARARGAVSFGSPLGLAEIEARIKWGGDK